MTEARVHALGEGRVSIREEAITEFHDGVNERQGLVSYDSFTFHIQEGEPVGSAVSQACFSMFLLGVQAALDHPEACVAFLAPLKDAQQAKLARYIMLGEDTR